MRKQGNVQRKRKCYENSRTPWRPKTWHCNSSKTQHREVTLDVEETRVTSSKNGGHARHGDKCHPRSRKDARTSPKRKNCICASSCEGDVLHMYAHEIEIDAPTMLIALKITCFNPYQVGRTAPTIGGYSPCSRAAKSWTKIPSSKHNR